jgi:hypothetical protein
MIQHQIPQKNYLKVSQTHNISPRAKENLKKNESLHIYLFILKRNMISATPNTLASNLMFAINSTRLKSEVGTTCVSYFLEQRQGWNMDALHMECLLDALCVWLPHVLTPVGTPKEVRAIRSVISAMRCRWSVFLSCPLKLEGGGSNHRFSSDRTVICVQKSHN